MDLLTLGRVLRRRWYVVVPVVSLAAVAAVLVALNTPSTYEASGWLALETPELSPGDLPSSVVEVQALADEIVDDLSTDEVSVRQADESTFEIAASSGEANDAETLVNRVVDDLTAAVESVQDGSGVPVSERLRLRQITPSVVAEQQPDGSFVARTTLFLDNPAATADNPYGANASTSRLLEVAVTGNAGRAQFEELVGQNFDFEVILQQRDAAPLLQIVTLGPEESRVLDAFYDVRDMLATELDVRQERAQVPPAARVTLGIVDAPLEVEDVSPPVSRATAGVAGLGVILAIGLAIALESLSSRKRGAVGDPEKASSASVARSGDAPAAPAPVQRSGNAPDRSGSVQRSGGDVDAPAPSEPSADVVAAPAPVERWGDVPVVLGWEDDSGPEPDVAEPTGRPGDVPVVFSYAQESGDTPVAPRDADADAAAVESRSGEASGDAADASGPAGRPGDVASARTFTARSGGAPVASRSEEADTSDEPDESEAPGVTPRPAGQGTGDAAGVSRSAGRPGDVADEPVADERSGDAPVASRPENADAAAVESRSGEASGDAADVSGSAGRPGDVAAELVPTERSGDAPVGPGPAEESGGVVDTPEPRERSGDAAVGSGAGERPGAVVPAPASTFADPSSGAPGASGALEPGEPRESAVAPASADRSSEAPVAPRDVERSGGAADASAASEWAGSWSFQRRRGPTVPAAWPDTNVREGNEPTPDLGSARPLGPSSHEPSVRSSRKSADDRADPEA